MNDDLQNALKRLINTIHLLIVLFVIFWLINQFVLANEQLEYEAKIEKILESDH